jgi:hypothetical protein
MLMPTKVVRHDLAVVHPRSHRRLYRAVLPLKARKRVVPSISDETAAVIKVCVIKPHLVIRGLATVV